MAVRPIQCIVMQSGKFMAGNGLMHCKCSICNHESREACIKGHCHCCNLEDMFSILSQHEFESSQSKSVVTKEHLNEGIIIGQCLTFWRSVQDSKNA
jgi:hypothetical protein